ncbi:MAG: NADH-quinone oxidoreductase subunit J [Rubrivivax sp.]|nr:MAG: NADH-quinone oxidoreductase subunit J [Rubrivivax sp.]
METLTLLFYAFSFVLVYAAFRVITAKSPVSAALHLVLAFFNASCIWMLLEAEFLAIALVLVYVGAVMVLFLFVVMMLDINTDSMRRGFWKHFPLAGVIGAVIAVEMAFVLTRGFELKTATPFAPDVAKLPNTKALGIELYTNYLFPVQVAAVLLLVAIIAAIALTHRQRKDSRSQKPGEQVKAKKADRLRIVKMAPVIEQPSLPVAPAAPADGAAPTPGGKA